MTFILRNFFFKNPQSKYFYIFVLTCTLIFFYKSAYISSDFGYHWAEDYASIDSIKKSFESATLLPANYSYPSFIYLVSLISTLFYYFGEYKIIGVGDFLHFVTINSNKSNIINFSITDIDQLRIFLRKVFIIISGFASIFIFIAIRLFGLRWISALFGSLVILSSFHYWSMSRWIATDTIAATFISGAILMKVLYFRTRNINFIYLITAFVALATSTKYTLGVFLLIPIYYVNYEKISIKKNIFIFLIFSSIFLLITPGSIIQPLKFIGDVYFEMQHYKVLGNGIYSVEPGLSHLKKFLEFLFLRISSTYTLISFLISFFSCIGIYIFISNKSKKKKYGDQKKNNLQINFGEKIIILLILLFYIIFFSNQKAMMVRNYIFFLPFIAFFFSITLNKIIDFFLKKKFYYQVLFLLSVLIIFFSFNLSKIYVAATSLEYNKLTDYKKNIDEFIFNNKNKKIALSSEAATFFKDFPKQELKKIDINEIDYLVYLNYEFIYLYPEIDKKYYGKFANNINTYFLLYGPKDIDLDYYPDWLGKSRILFVKNKEVIKLLVGFYNPSKLFLIKN